MAFDVLRLGDKDLRPERLIDRKLELRRVVSQGIPPLIYADHVEFEKASELDLEGIVAKHQHSPYSPSQTSWFKIRNRNYSQWVGRDELFERERHQEPVPGWHSCTLAAAIED